MFEQLAAYLKERTSPGEEDLASVLSFFKPLKVKKNEFLVLHGQTEQRMYFVNKGCLRIFFINEQGDEATRYIAFENNFATALVSFITSQPSLEYIQAVESSELLYINRKDIQHLLNASPAWQTFYRHYLEMAYVNNTNRLMSFITMEAGQRYKQLLEENPKAIKRLPNKLLASFLNISPETLSRLKTRDNLKITRKPKLDHPGS